MGKVFAIASIALRSAFRSKLVLTMIVVLAVINIALPLTVKDNGTIASKVQVLVSYTLAFSQIVLAIATLWSACAAVSQEIQEENIHLVLTKPVSRLQVWFGKWLGLLMMNAILLSITGLTVYGLLRYQTRASVLEDEQKIELAEQILIAREKVTPIPPDIDGAALIQLQAIKEKGGLDGVDPQDKLEEIKQRLLFSAYSAPRDQHVTWVMQLQRHPHPDQPIFLNYKFNAGFASGEKIRGAFWLGNRARPNAHMIPVEHVPGANSLKIPNEMVHSDEPLYITYASAPETNLSAQFEPDDGVVLLYRRGSFEGNLFRALLVLFFHLSLYAAIGLTAGTLFSMPVAAFTSIFLILLQLFGRFIGEMAQQAVVFGDEDKDMGLFMDTVNALAMLVYRGADLLLKPLQAFNPLEMLSNGVQISWTQVAMECAIKLLLYGGVTGFFGILFFNRREIGLPQ